MLLSGILSILPLGRISAEGVTPPSDVAALLALVPGLTADETERILFSLSQGTVPGPRTAGKTASGTVARTFGRSGGPQLIPSVDQAKVLHDRFSALSPGPEPGSGPGFGVETLLLGRIPDGLSGDPSLIGTLYGILTSVSTMEGLTYHSVSRGETRLLFEKSHIVEGPESRRRLPDPAPGTVPGSQSFHILQKDTTFGENIYRLDYHVSTGALLLTLENVTPLRYGFINAVGAGQFQIHLLVVPRGDHLLFYGLAGAGSFGISMLRARVEVSFTNRVVALCSWFLDELERKAR